MAYLQLLRSNPDFTKLWLAQVVSLLGDWFNLIVLSALIISYTEDTPYQGLAVSGYLLARLLPPLLIRPIAGVIVDRFDRKRLLIFSDLSRAGTVFLLLFALSPDRLWLIYLLTVIQFMLSSLFEPAKNALIPSLLRRDDLVIGNTLSSVTWSVMLALGAIVGGLVASQFGTTIALIIDSGTFVLSALLVAGIRIVYPAVTDTETHQVSDKSDRTFRQGLRYLRQHPATAAAIFVKAGLSIGSVDAVLIIYGTQLFVIGEQGTTSMAILWSAFGFGAILGPVLTNRFSDGTVRILRRLMIVGFIWATVGWFFFGLAPTFELAILALMLRSMGGSVNWTYSSVIIQKVVPDEYLGRMFSIDFAGFELMQALSAIVVGMLIDSVGSENVQQVVIWTGMASIIPLVIWVWAVQRLDHQDLKRKRQPLVGD